MLDFHRTFEKSTVWIKINFRPRDYLKIIILAIKFCDFLLNLADLHFFER
ncbi:conserved hypothetical protein [Aggregatibacter segnis ATCC 33393]|uniref:Uncharacterized protein n=1 Tax=Aggregatibacter segnis ATCC 33393 TaxID=888057 RepID=E6KW18_9PAST|nr:conserved hypothetical protein [Aggregatibacter segnis ATCC 33393]